MARRVVDSTPWLFGRMERKDVDKLMMDRGNHEAMFLVRESTRTVGDFVLSVVIEGKVQHFIITASGQKFYIDDGPQFPCLPDLVNYYTYTADRLPCKLGRPCFRDASLQPSDDQYESVDRDFPVAQKSASLKKLPNGLSALMGGAAPAAAAAAPARPPSRDSQPTTSRPVPPPVPADDTDDAPPPIIRRQGSGAPAPAPAPAAAAPPPLTRNESFDQTDEPEDTSNAGSGWKKAQKAVATAAPANREKLAQVPRVKKWIDAAATVHSQDLKIQEEERRNLPEGISKDAVRNAGKHEEAFSAAALAEEKLYLMWLNNKLKKLGKEEVRDLGPSLVAQANSIIEIIALMSGQKPPMYSVRAAVIQQEIDNWHVVVKWMRKLGIQVDADGSENDVSIDPLTLHKADRREILKLFSKLLMFENSCK